MAFVKQSKLLLDTGCCRCDEKRWPFVQGREQSNLYKRSAMSTLKAFAILFVILTSLANLEIVACQNKVDKPMSTTLPEGSQEERLAIVVVSMATWNEKSQLRVLHLEDEAAALQPRSEAFLRRFESAHQLDAESILLPVETKRTTPQTLDIGNMTKYNKTISDKDLKKVSSGKKGKMGIYIITCVMVAVCVGGLTVIICVAKANAHKDYEIAQQRREASANAALRRSQDRLDQGQNASGIEERGIDVEMGATSNGTPIVRLNSHSAHNGEDTTDV